MLKSLPANHSFSSYMEAQLLVSFFNLLTYCSHPAISVAYDLKLLIEKGIYDVLRPNWVTDSIALGHPAPFRKKYSLPTPPHFLIHEICFQILFPCKQRQN